MKTSIANTVGGIRDKIVEGFKAAISFITGLPQQALQWGRDIIQGIINGITEKFEALKKKAAEIAGAIKDFIGFSEPEEGPLSDFHTYMPDMIELMTKGITQGIPEVQRAMNQLTSTMVPPMQTAQEAGTNQTNTTNTVSINVYGAAGQNVNELANIIEQRIADNVVRRGAAFA
jgi:phage-related protein